jgi:hypothetical protein
VKKKRLLIRSIPNISRYDFDKANEMPDECEQFEEICEHINEGHRYLRHFVKTEYLACQSGNDDTETFNVWLILFYETK